MADLIDRQAAIDGLKKIPDLTVYAYCSFLDMLMNMPSAQPERCEDCVNFSKTRLLIPQPEIIRCKDCKYYDGSPCEIVDWYNTADDFCSYGERKDGRFN